ncbi:hypothetical protein ES703_02390 [subsurface metagenome]
MIASVIAPAILTISSLSVNPASASPDPVGKTTIGLYNLCTLIIENSAGNYENIVRGKENAYTEDHDAYPPQQYYVSGDRPPVMAAKRVGSGAVVVAGIGCTCRDGRWNSVNNPDKHLDILLDCAFQWMVPGAENVLWYEGYNVFNNTTACGQLVAALGGKGYSIVGDNTEPITSSLLSPYDILINPQMELGSEGTGGNPDLLPDDDVAAIKGFVEGGGGLLILDGGDHGGWSFCEVQNKILENLNMGIYLQSDSMLDNVNNWDHNYEMFADVDNTTAIGSAYENATAQLEDYEVAVDISPSNRRGMPGTTLIYYVKVTNTGRMDDNYDLTVVDTENWSLDISPAGLFVENGKFEWAVLEVRIPDEASLGAEDIITVTATSRTDNTVSDNGACTATVPIHVSKVDEVKISNPYKNYDNWYKGNLQSHTENSDGANTASEMMSTYRENGFHFNSITDDDHITDSEAFTDLPYFLGIIGTELKVEGDMIAIDISTLVDENQSWVEVVDNILAQGGLPIPASISWSGSPFSLENLRQCIDAGSRLIELQGGTVEEALIARETWDTLLTEGRLVYGLMNDDAHNIDRVSRWGWNMVNSPELTKDAILQNLEEGNSYCVQGYFLRVGIGPEIYSITVENENAISISSSGNHVLFIGDNGVVLDSENLIGEMASSGIPFGVSYVRMEVYGDNGGVSCTQPMMVSSVKFDLVTPYKISLNINLWLENGSKVVAKFYSYDNIYQGENVLENFIPPARIVKFENVPHPQNEYIEKVVLQVTGENTENVISTIASFTAPQTGWAAFGLEDLYTVSLEKNLDIHQGSKLVVKFYTYGDAYESENVIENFSPPWHVEENELARHPDGVGVKQARLDLTTNDTSNVISTIASFTVRKVDLETRFMEIPMYWAAAPPDEKVELEIEFMEIPMYWAGAPS